MVDDVVDVFVEEAEEDALHMALYYRARAFISKRSFCHRQSASALAGIAYAARWSCGFLLHYFEPISPRP